HECRDAQRVIEYCSKRLPEGDVVVRYEKLTDDAESEVRRICRQLGLKFESHLTVPTTLGRQVVVSTSSRQTKEVFRQVARWQTDLTWFEITTIWFYFRCVAPVILPLGLR